MDTEAPQADTEAPQADSAVGRQVIKSIFSITIVDLHSCLLQTV